MELRNIENKKYSFLHYVYYKLYSILKKTEESSGSLAISELLAMLVLTILQFFNIWLLVSLLIAFAKIKPPIASIFVLFFGLIVANYLIFVQKNKYLNVAVFFDSSKNRSLLMNISFYLYISLTLLTPYFMYLISKLQ